MGYWDVVAYDEFEQDKGSKRVDGDLVKILQNYLANKSFNRGKETYQATASMAFIGNTKHTVPYMLKNSHLFESIPIGYIKGAFLDRIHLYIPGWEIRMLKNSVFSTSYGFIVDYLAEILREMRKSDHSGILDPLVKLHGSLSTRDKTAIRKTFSGLAKLIYPDKMMTQEQILELLDFSIEGRKRVKDQLYIIDETFRSEPVEFTYIINVSGDTAAIETLEKLNYFTDVADKKKVETTIIDEIKAPLLPKQVTIKDNQTGISYQKLFGDYLKGARQIIVTDPYIRHYYQFKNFLEFCIMLGNNKEVEEETNLHLVTWNDEVHRNDSIDNLEELQGNLLELGINLTYEFKDLHDRTIVADNGWKITLGRGLDIFERREGKFVVGDVVQEKRKCKNCEITYLK